MKRVFSRQLSLPPGAPWDQAAAAHVDAVNGAPVPVDDLLIHVSRLGFWLPGRPSSFVIAYARRADVAGVLTSAVQVDGRRLTLRFAEASIRRGRAVLQLAALAAGIVGIGLAITGGLTAIELRNGRETALESGETRLAARVQLEARRRAVLEETWAIEGIGAKATTADVARDLNILARQRSESAGVVRVLWTPEATLVDSLGPLAPANSATRVSRSGQTTPGVHRWLVLRASK